MNITGTDVCKRASDIMIVDDSLMTVISAVAWGRNVYDNVQSVLQHHFIIRFNALVTVIVISLTIGQTPLHVIQIIWINIIIEPLAAFALAIEMPNP